MDLQMREFADILLEGMEDCMRRYVDVTIAMGATEDEALESLKWAIEGFIKYEYEEGECCDDV